MIVFFDLDGTLLDHETALCTAALAFREHFADLAAVEPSAFLERWTTAHETHIARYRHGHISFEQQRRERLRQVFQLPLSDDDADHRFEIYLQAYEASWRLFPDALHCLDRLGQRPLALITNGDSEQQRKKLAATAIADRFTSVLVAGDIGVSKPDPRIFTHACAQMAVDPRDAVYVGDQLRVDVLPAIEAGLRGIWLDRTGPREPEPQVPRISSLAELPEIVDTIA